MSGLRFILFNVERGLCIFIRTPTDYGIMIDCGRSQYFSPVEWLVENQAPTLTPWNEFQLTKLIVTHPHDDHVEDIDNLIKYFRPAILHRHTDLDWNAILRPPDGDPSLNANHYYSWQQSYNQPVTVSPYLGIGLELYSVPYERARYINPNIQHALNNSSYVSILTYQTLYSVRKFVIPGDIEKEGWQELLKNQSFCNAVYGADFFVTSHHGHDSGFCFDLYEKMGLPLINLTSEKSSDHNVCSLYSSSAYTKGMIVNGKNRYHLTTRQDGHILIFISDHDDIIISTSGVN